MYKILRVKKTNFFDIFNGEGWNNWTRVYLNNQNKLDVIKGNSLSTFQLRHLVGKIYKLVTVKDKSK